MARLRNGADGTPSTEELKRWYAENRQSIENYAKADASVITLRDVTQSITTKNIQTIDKEELKSYIKKIGSSEKKLRDTSRYLFYRSNIYFRLVYWYATMFNLDCRKVTPPYKISGGNNAQSMLKSYEDTLKILDNLNNQGNMIEALINVFVQDVFYAIKYSDENGTFYFPLDPDECVIDGRYDTGDFSFALNMSCWTSTKRRKIIDYLGSPLKEMMAEYEADTTHKYKHVKDEYAFVLKFRTDTWDMVAPVLLSTFLSLANLSDLEDIQAEADALSIYKLIYLPMETITGSKNSDDFAVSPAISLRYLQRMIDNQAVPADVGVCAIPGSELKTIDFTKTADSDTTSVEKAANQVLQTAGGGAVLNANNITSSAAFAAWLKSETEFAISSLLPQIDGYTNRMLKYELGDKACKVKHLPVSVYTQKDMADQFLQANQYSYSYRMAYGTLIGMSEWETLATLYFETEVLHLPELMKNPLNSSFTTTTDATDDGYTTETGQGAPEKDATELTPSGDRDRNQ